MLFLKITLPMDSRRKRSQKPIGMSSKESVSEPLLGNNRTLIEVKNVMEANKKA